MKKVEFKKKRNKTTAAVLTGLSQIPLQGMKYEGSRIINNIQVEKLGSKVVFSRFGCDSVKLIFSSKDGNGMDLVIPHLNEDYKLIIEPTLVKHMTQTVSTLGNKIDTNPIIGVKSKGPKKLHKVFVFEQNLTNEMIESGVIHLVNESKVSISML